MLAASLIASNLNFAQLMRKAPYLIYTGHNTEMQVLWQLNTTATCTLEWGTDLSYSLGSIQTSQFGIDHQHTYTITNLTPGTKYYYRVDIDPVIYSGSFYSAPDDDATSLKFFAYGDTRTHPENHDAVAKEIVNTFLEDEEFQSLVISMGDFTTTNTETDWDNEFFDPSYLNIQEMLRSLPYQGARGNHEGTGTKFKKYFPYPHVDDFYWSFDYGPAHFVIIDQYEDNFPGPAQKIWLENELASSNKPWKFVYLHEPGWTASTGFNPVVRDYIQPLCEQYRVAILFAGHRHLYARAIVKDVIHITTGGG